MSELQNLTDKIRQQVDQELSRLDKARLLAAQESARLEALLAETRSAPNTATQTPEDNLNGKHREVYELAEQGLEPLEIAQQTGQSLGEIQLILALRKSE